MAILVVCIAESPCRSCVGQVVAEDFLFVTIAALLATYEILPAPGKRVPTPVWIDAIFTFVHVGQMVSNADGCHREPEPFPCRFVPRNEQLLHALAEDIA